MSCCNKILNIGIINCCGISTVKLPVSVLNDGIYTLQIQFLDKIKTDSDEFIAGDFLIFHFTGLNENFTYTGWLEDSTGLRLLINNFDCIEFETKCFETDDES